MKLTNTSIIPVNQDGTLTIYSIARDTVDTGKGTVCLSSDDVMRMYEYRSERKGRYDQDIAFFSDVESAKEEFEKEPVHEHHNGECEIFFLRRWSLSGIEPESISIGDLFEYYDGHEDVDFKTDTIYVSKEITVVEDDVYRYYFSHFNDAMEFCTDEEEEHTGKCTVSEYDVPVFYLHQEPEDIWEIALQRAPSRVILLRCEEVDG